MRRAAEKRGDGKAPAATSPVTFSVGETFEIAAHHRMEGRSAQAQSLCREILERDPGHIPSLNLLGVIAQESGRPNNAIKYLSRAIALDGRDPTSHFNVARAYEGLGRRDSASAHFRQAIVMGLPDAEALIKRNSVVAASLRRIAETWPRRLTLDELCGAEGVAALADDLLLVSLLRTRPVFDLALERLLTALRSALLRVSIETPTALRGDKVLGFCAALAQQCFLNEYVFAVGEDEVASVQELHDLVAERTKGGGEIAPQWLALLAAYRPLHTLADATALLERAWPEALAGLLTMQIREPIQEAQDRDAIPAVTAIDPASREVQQQYEENPYPRWTAAMPALPGALDDHLRRLFPAASFTPPGAVADVLIAGCGTGSHSVRTAERYPDARVLAVDLSRASLAYARRKTRELGLTNMEYVHGDILKLGALERRFDLIEAMGVLHHLAEPEAGWRVLLSLLRPGGVMLVGLYSELARRGVTAARTFAAERGYRATAQDIRACRQELILRNTVPGGGFADFFTMSGCRDLMFNVIEHRFTIPGIKALLEHSGVTFIGFNVDAETERQFRLQFPDPAAASDLDRWHAFETAHPRTFAGMYVFWVQKTA